MFETRIRVRYAETDAQGIVYNGSYNVYLEVARFEMFEEILSVDEAKCLWERLAVKEVGVTFFSPLRFPDQVVVTTSIQHVGRSSLCLNHNVQKAGEQAVVTVARVVLIYLSPSGDAAEPLPEGIRQLLDAHWENNTDHITLTNT